MTARAPCGKDSGQRKEIRSAPGRIMHVSYVLYLYANFMNFICAPAVACNQWVYSSLATMRKWAGGTTAGGA